MKRFVFNSEEKNSTLHIRLLGEWYFIKFIRINVIRMM